MNLQTFDNSLTPKESNGGVVLTATQEGEKVCPPVVLVKLNGVTWRAFLDTRETACYATGYILNRSERVPSRTLTHQYRPMWTPLPIASWRGNNAENSARKNKKSAARGSERTPVGKLTKRSFRPACCSCQPFSETSSRNISNFVPRTESEHFETLKHTLQ